MARKSSHKPIPLAPLDCKDEAEVRRLIARFKEGRQEAFTELVNRYRDQVIALAYRVTRDPDEAADIAQNVFVKMSKNIWRYDQRRKFFTWLYRITMNASIDHMRKHQRHRHELLELVPEVSETARNGPEFALRRRQLQEHIEEAAKVLNEKQRSAFMLRDVAGCKVDDVATVMEMPEATVRWYLHRARHRIRKELSRRCPHLLLFMGIR